jgi:hypothetical protein
MLHLYTGSKRRRVRKEAAMIEFYFAELAQVVLAFLLSLLQVHAHIAAALLPW